MPILQWLNKAEAVKTAQSVLYRILENDPKMSVKPSWRFVRQGCDECRLTAGRVAIEKVKGKSNNGFLHQSLQAMMNSYSDTEEYDLEVIFGKIICLNRRAEGRVTPTIKDKFEGLCYLSIR